MRRWQFLIGFFFLFFIIIFQNCQGRFLKVNQSSENQTRILPVPQQDLPPARAFIGPQGVDYPDCSGGTRVHPWKSWSLPFKSGCIKPGDAIYLLAGVYNVEDAVFVDDFKNGFIRFNGEPEKPVYLIADPKAQGPWPVKIRGKFVVWGEWGVIHGIEFESTGGYPFSVFASHFTLRDSFVHGRLEDILATQKDPTDPTHSYDCIKFGLRTSFPSGPRTEDLQILNNEIGDCSEDCIDVTGSKNLIYRGNHIYNCNSVHIKGGTENILVEQNRIHGIRKEGINAAAMACPDAYCGSPDIPKLPVSERFVAKNVTIRNNLIYDINSTAIAARGWRNVNIYNNTIYNTNTAITFGQTGFDFTDEIAKDYCSNNKPDCAPCIYISSNCWQIRTYHSQNTSMFNNIASEVLSGVSIDRNASESFSAKNNVYHRSDGPVQFQLFGNQLSTQSFSLSNFYFQTNSFETDPLLTQPEKGHFAVSDQSIVCGKGFSIELPFDFYGQKRGSPPDIGAIECTK